jgi:hypothetical protein
MSPKWLIFLSIFWPSVVFGQDSIFVPLDSGEAMAPAVVPADALARYVALQAGLDTVVYGFDEAASQVHKHTRLFEAAELKNRESRFLNPEQPAQRMTLSEQARYDLLVREPTLCKNLNDAISQYVTQHTAELEGVVQQLMAQTSAMDDVAKNAFAQKLQTALAASSPHKRRAQEILYQCLYKNKGATGLPLDYSVEKTMRNWFMIQQPLIEAWIGHVD